MMFHSEDDRWVVACEDRDTNALAAGTHLLVRIARRGGAEVPAKHATVIAAAATIVLAQNRPAASAAQSMRAASGNWAQQGRALVNASHNVAHRPMQPRSLGGSRTAAEPAARLKGGHGEAAD